MGPPKIGSLSFTTSYTSLSCLACRAPAQPCEMGPLEHSVRARPWGCQAPQLARHLPLQGTGRHIKGRPGPLMGCLRTSSLTDGRNTATKRPAQVGPAALRWGQACELRAVWWGLVRSHGEHCCCKGRMSSSQGGVQANGSGAGCVFLSGQQVASLFSGWLVPDPKRTQHSQARPDHNTSPWYWTCSPC